LNYLKLIHNCNDLRDGQRCNWIKQEYNWILVNFENIAVQSLEDFIGYVLGKLKLQNDDKDLDNLTEPTIILMDNIKFGLELSESSEKNY